MAMKSYFMDELHSIRAGIVNCKSKTKDSNSVDVKVSEVQSIIVSTKAENKLLRESCSNKHKLLEVVLEHKSVLNKEKSKQVVDPNDRQANLNKSKSDSQKHMGLDKSNGKKPEHIKTTNNVKNNGEKPQADRTNNGTIASKDSVIIVPNTLIKNVIIRVIFRNISRYKPWYFAFPHSKGSFENIYSWFN